MKQPYTSRPTEIFCTKSSPEIHEIVIDFCKRHGIPIYESTKNRKYDEDFKYLAWDTGFMSPKYMVVGSSVNCGELTLSDFLAKFRTETESKEKKKERLISELLEKCEKLSEVAAIAKEIKQL